MWELPHTCRTSGHDTSLLITPFSFHFVMLSSFSSWVFLACPLALVLLLVGDKWNEVGSHQFVTFKFGMWSRWKIKFWAFLAHLHLNIHLCSLKATVRSSQHCTPLVTESVFQREEWSSQLNSEICRETIQRGSLGICGVFIARGDLLPLWNVKNKLSWGVFTFPFSFSKHTLFRLHMFGEKNISG